MIIATGTSETKLNIPGEKEYSNIGVSYCATCDGHLTKGKKVAIFGGTEEAVNSAIYLSKIASSVSLFVPTEQISSVVHNLDVVKQLGVSIVFNAKPLEFFGNTYSLTGGNISIDNEIKKFSFDFAFINEGYSPSTDFISDQSIINESKIVIVNPADKSTNLKGLFAVGDVSKEEDRQIITATSDGTIAALSAIKLLQQNKK
jgi:thioredoxin reductase (NADPH)